MFSDNTSLYMCIYIMTFFVIVCIIDVSGLYPLMDNLAILIIFMLTFIVTVVNVFINSNSKKLPEESEDESPEFRQL